MFSRQNLFSKLRRFDWLLLSAVILLVFLGLAAIYSSSLNSSGAELSVFHKQAVFFLVGLVMLLLFALIDYRFYASYSAVVYIAGIVVLVLLLIFGENLRGTTGWFSFGGFTLQPVEFFKIILVFFFAHYFTRKRQFKHLTWSLILRSAAWMSIPFALVIYQPDLGSAIILFFTWLLMLMMAGIRKSQLIIVFLAIAVLVVGAWFFALKGYQQDRVLTFLNPNRDPLGAGYNVSQSIIAVGAGKLWGRGLGLGSQSQLNFLPAQVTDFVFAVISEELGFLGAMLVLGFFGFLFYRIFLILRNSQDDFSSLLISGFAGVFLVQVTINVGMNIGVMPVTGIPLPFISYGGSSLLSTLIMIGVLESIVLRQNKK